MARVSELRILRPIRSLLGPVSDVSTKLSSTWSNILSRILLLQTRTGLVISREILNEFVDVIRRPKFREYVGDKDVEGFLRLLLRVAEVVDANLVPHIVPDESDNTVLAAARDARAEFIVSGDRHLLNLRKFKQAKIVSAAQRLKAL